MATGTIRKRGESWYLDIHTGRVVDGKHERIRRRSDALTRAGAQEELNAELYRLRNTSAEATSNRFPLADLLDRWKQSVGRTVMNARTAGEYVRHVDRIASRLQEIRFVDELTIEVVEAALSAIATENSTNTANKSLDKLKAALEYGVLNRLIQSNPLKAQKHLRLVRKKFRRDLHPNEVEALLREATELFRTIWFAYVSTGMRENELIHLRVEDVSLLKKQIRVREREGRKIKTASAGRTIRWGKSWPAR